MTSKRTIFAALFLLALAPALASPARADVDTKDANGAVQTFNTTVDGSGDHTSQTMSTDGVGNRVGTNSVPVQVGDAGGSLTVDAASLPLPTGAATSANQSTELSTLSTISTLVARIGELITTGADAVVNTTDHQAVGAFGYGYNGASWDRLRSTIANGLVVDVSRVTGSVTTTATATGAAANGAAVSGNPVLIAGSDSSNVRSMFVDSTGRVIIVGQVGHDAPNGSFNPLFTAGTASAAAPANVSADGDIVRFWALRNGAQVVNLSAAGVLLEGDATNGLETDVRRVATAATVYTNQVNVATPGTEVTLGGSQALIEGCSVKAFTGNGGNIFVGLNGVASTTGYILDAGESQFIPIDNRATLFVDTDNAGDDVSYICW